MSNKMQQAKKKQLLLAMNMFSLCRLKGYKNSDLRDKISLAFCRLTPKGLSRFMKWRLGKG
jgi:hypothetical protein